MNALLNLFRQAWQNAPLSPQERGLLRFIKSSLVSALITAVLACAGYLSNWHTISPQVVLAAFVGTFLHTIIDSVAKYQAASAEPAPAAYTAPALPAAPSDANSQDTALNLVGLAAQFNTQQAPPTASDAPAGS